MGEGRGGGINNSLSVESRREKLFAKNEAKDGKVQRVKIGDNLMENLWSRQLFLILNRSPFWANPIQFSFF